jgi:hypothetical protein
MVLHYVALAPVTFEPKSLQRSTEQYLLGSWRSNFPTKYSRLSDPFRTERLS